MAPDAEIFIGLFVRQGRRLCEISIAQSFDHAMVGFVFIDTDFAQLELIEIAQEVLVHRGRETFIGNGIKDVVFDIDMLNEEGNIVLGVMQDILDGIAITLLVGGDKLGEVANVVPSRNMIFQQRPDTVAIGWVEALLQGGEKHGLFFYMMAFIDKDGVEIDQRFEVIDIDLLAGLELFAEFIENSYGYFYGVMLFFELFGGLHLYLQNK
jgi:hypothetical protein